MKKSKIFLTTGTLVLAVTAIFATKAAKKFTPSVLTARQSSSAPVLYINVASETDLPMTTRNNSTHSDHQLKLGLNGTEDVLITRSAGTPVLYF